MSRAKKELTFTPATADYPAHSFRQRTRREFDDKIILDREKLLPQEFAKQLDILAAFHTDILRLAFKTDGLKKGETIDGPDGQKMTRKDVRAMSSQFKKTLKQLRKNYSAQGKPYVSEMSESYESYE